MSLKILLATDHYPPFIGGAHRQVQLLARELHQRGYAASVATVWHGGLPLEEDEAGVRVHRIKQLRTWLPGSVRDRQQRHQPPFPDPVTVSGLRRLIETLHPDVVHTYGWFSYSCAAALQGKDIPLVISGRDYGYSCATRSMLYRGQPCSGPALLKCLECAADFYGAGKGYTAVLSLAAGRTLLWRKVSGIHAVSQFVLDIIARDFVKLDQARLERNGGPVVERVIPSFLLDADERSSDSAFLQRLPAEPFILYVGGLQLRKGLTSLLEAYTLLQTPPPLVLIGYVAADTPKTFPPGITVLPDVSHPNVMAAWERCLFGVIPSLWPDPSPGVVREAISKGKALVTTNVGGTPEMIDDGHNGLLVPPGQSEPLARAMQRLIDDAALRERLGRAALDRAYLYKAETVIPQFEQVYRQLIQGRAPSERS